MLNLQENWVENAIMNIEETGIIMDILKAAYPQFYRGQSETDIINAINLWSEMFADDDVAFVAAAVKSYIAIDEKGYPPHIGAIKNTMHNLTKIGGMDSSQAWDLVRKAASKSGYGAGEEFRKLPENVRSVVGSPSQLYEWSQMDSDIFNSVVASNFQRAYKAREESSKRDALLPKDIKKIVSSISQKMALESNNRLNDEKEREKAEIIKDIFS